MRDPVPALLVTGFLGAGKTTLLRRVLESSAGRRVAVVVNEFGEVGFDGELIASVCGDVVELINGCVCCRVADDLVPTLEALVERDPPLDAILIETSGLALPKPVVDAFAFPTLARRARLGGVVVVADAPVLASGAFDGVLEALRSPPSLEPRRPSALHEGTDGTDDPLGEVLEDQFRAADLVVLAKTDGMDDGAARALGAVLRARLPEGVALVDGRDALAPLEAGLRRGPSRPSRHDLEAEHDHDDFESVVVEGGAVRDRAALERAVAGAVSARGLLRVKGFVAVAGAARRFALQATTSATTTTADRAWAPDDTPATRLVVIARKGAIPGDIRDVLLGETP
jgi:cobalamin biosynthesis protein CobW